MTEEKAPLITRDMFIDTCRAIVAESPDTSYTAPEGYGCVYAQLTEQGEWEPSCLVGQVIHRIDPELFDQLFVNGADDYGDCGMNEEPIGDVNDAEASNGRPILDFETSVFATRLQFAQDGGTPWGEAFRITEALLK